MKAATMPIMLKTDETAKLEELLGKHRYYSGLLAAAPLLTAESLTIFTEPMEVASTDSAPADDEIDEDETEIEFDDEEDDGSQVTLVEIDDTERKQLDSALRGILTRRLAKLNIELKKFGVTISDE